MKPTLNMGDLIITGPSNGPFGAKITSGTIVTYETGQSLVSHRVVSINNNVLVTKGDAVKVTDSQQVEMSQVKGVYILKIPKLGYLSAFIRTKLGWFVLIILPAAVLLGLIIKEIIKEALSQTLADSRRR